MFSIHFSFFQCLKIHIASCFPTAPEIQENVEEMWTRYRKIWEIMENDMVAKASGRGTASLWPSYPYFQDFLGWAGIPAGHA